MGLEFLTRVRRTTLWLGAIAGLMVASYRGPMLGLAFGLGALWSLSNLRLIESLIVALTGDARGTLAATKRAAITLGGMLALFAAGGLLLANLAPVFLLAGFLLPFAVIVLKAVSSILLGSRLWQSVVRSPWRATLAVLVLGVAAWLLVSNLARAQEHGAPSAETPAAEPPTTETHATESHGAAAHEGGHEEAQGPQKFPNVITVLARAFPDATWAHFLHQYESVIFAMLVALILSIIAIVATRNPQMIPGKLQNVVEMVVESLYDFVVGILGEKHGRRYVPFLGSLFIYILAMNLFGMIPFMDSPTSSLNITLAMALTVFLFSQYIGFKELGVVGYIDHLCGSPRSAISWGLVPLMLPIHLLGELAKPISLSCRLFGNIFGEDMLLVAFASLGVTVLAFTHLPIGLPLQLPFLFLALLTSTLQALVFTVLSTIYFLLMLPHDDHGHEGEVQHAHP